MIDWIKVRREGRIKLVQVEQREIEDYILISKLPDTQTVSTFDFPKHWNVSGVWYDQRRQSFMFMILSPNFSQVVEGAEPETIIADRHIIEIQRKAVSA